MVNTHDTSPPSPAASTASDSSASSGPPRTPETPASLPLGMPTFMNFTGENAVNGMPSLTGGVKRTKRRANTAERRATHNAVERARRETLNGRFLDLAGMLTNLSQIRRPSKSAIVNSSIAHLNAAGRHRALAAQQLRALQSEADALRAEVNEWRARAGVVKLDEPVRSDAFGVVLRGELEFDDSEIIVDGDDEDVEASPIDASQSPIVESKPVPAAVTVAAVGPPEYTEAPYTEEPALDEYTMLQQQRQQHAELLAAQQEQLHRHLAQQQHYAQAHAQQHAQHYYPVPGSPTIVGPYYDEHTEWAVALEKQHHHQMLEQHHW